MRIRVMPSSARQQREDLLEATCRGDLPGAAAQVPLACHVGVITGATQHFRERCGVGAQTVVAPGTDSCGVVVDAGVEHRAGGIAFDCGVVVEEPRAFFGQARQIWRRHLAAVEGNVREPQVVGDDQEEVGLRCTTGDDQAACRGGEHRPSVVPRGDRPVADRPKPFRGVARRETRRKDRGNAQSGRFGQMMERQKWALWLLSKPSPSGGVRKCFATSSKMGS